MGSPEGEQRNQSVSNPGRPAGDRRLDPRYYDDYDAKRRPQVNTEVRLFEKGGQIYFTYNEDIYSKIPALQMRADGLAATTLQMDAAERADFRTTATDWELQNSPIAQTARRYVPIVDDVGQPLAYLRVYWITGVAHVETVDQNGKQLNDMVIAEKPLESDVWGNELVAAIATLGGSLLIKALARAAITSASRFLVVAVAETAIDAARGVTVNAIKATFLALRGMRARWFADKLRRNGQKVVVNIGGEAGPEELKQFGIQIAVNPSPRVKRFIPFLIKEDGENIGSLFADGSVERVVSRRLDKGFDVDRLSQGAAKVLKSGGDLEMHIFTADAEFMKSFATALERAGLRKVRFDMLPPVPGGKPVPTGKIFAVKP